MTRVVVRRESEGGEREGGRVEKEKGEREGVAVRE